MSKLEKLTRSLQAWYAKNKRDLPWRNSRDPYLIWLSEIILQQTQVKQGLPYFEKFIDKYPKVEDLADAPEDQVLRDWQGLGYYSRARNLHYTAKYISREKNGKFPESYNDILELKGVGPYTAAAISSFAFKEKKAVVDGNVMRVIARLFAIEEAINERAGAQKIEKLANDLIDPVNPDTHNQAMMEIGSQICTPVNPKCTECPISDFCMAFDLSRQKDFPVKIKKTKVKDLFFYYLVILRNDKIFMRKRSAKDIWQGLHDFPLIESEKEISDSEILNSKKLQKLFVQGYELLHFTEYQKHLLSHRRIRAKFLILQKDTEERPDLPNDFGNILPYTLEESRDLGKPILILNFLKKYIY